MIFGLGAALSWGFADYGAAVVARRSGVFPTLIVSQVVSILAFSVYFIASGPDGAAIGRIGGWVVPMSVVMAGAYYALYKGLELGPVSVVSPTAAAYAVFPVLLSAALLGERLSPVLTAGIATTIGGVILTSTDLRALRAGTPGTAKGLPWALLATVSFGVATYTVAWASKTAGWTTALWVSRASTTVVLLAVVVAGRGVGVSRIDGRGIAFAAGVGALDLIGAISYTIGSERGLVSIVSTASATFPLISVGAGVLLLHERPAFNQAVGVALVVGGLILLGLAH